MVQRPHGLTALRGQDHSSIVVPDLGVLQSPVRGSHSTGLVERLVLRSTRNMKGRFNFTGAGIGENEAVIDFTVLQER